MNWRQLSDSVVAEEHVNAVSQTSLSFTGSGWTQEIVSEVGGFAMKPITSTGLT